LTDFILSEKNVINLHIDICYRFTPTETAAASELERRWRLPIARIPASSSRAGPAASSCAGQTDTASVGAGPVTLASSAPFSRAGPADAAALLALTADRLWAHAAGLRRRTQLQV